MTPWTGAQAAGATGAHLHSREPERAFNRSHTWNTAVYIETYSDTLEIYSNKFETLLFLLVIDGDTAELQAAPGVPFKGAFIPTSTTNLMLQPMIELRTSRKQCRHSITGPNLQNYIWNKGAFGKKSCRQKYLRFSRLDRSVPHVTLAWDDSSCWPVSNLTMIVILYKVQERSRFDFVKDNNAQLIWWLARSKFPLAGWYLARSLLSSSTQAPDIWSYLTIKQNDQTLKHCTDAFHKGQIKSKKQNPKSVFLRILICFIIFRLDQG